MLNEQNLLWALFAVALMCGTAYAIVAPSSIDQHDVKYLPVYKGVSAVGTGAFLTLFACKRIGMTIPGIELAAVSFFIAAAGPSILALIVKMLPDLVAKKIGKEGDK